MGGSTECEWRQLDVSGAEGQWAGFLDESAVDGYWGEDSELFGSGSVFLFPQACLWYTDNVPGDQLCGVGLSVRFNSHLISIWHREGSRQKSIDAILALVLDELPDELKPKPDNYFYKKHSDHAGFKAPAVPVPVAAKIPVPVVAVEPPKDAA